jgi:hypothetical protein
MSLATMALRGLTAFAACAATAVLASSPAEATIHPIIQSINCAAAAAWEHAPVGDPPGQTPEGFTTDTQSVEDGFVIVSFPEPLELDQSDFRALQATGFIDEVITNADGLVTAVVVDLASVPKAVSGEGGAHCATG